MRHKLLRLSLRLRRVFNALGPGLVTGASDDDPSGIVTYAQAGAAFGYGTLWTALLTFPMMVSIQITCARIGYVSEQGLATLLRKHYSQWFAMPLVLALFVANTINIGADIGAVAAGIGLLVPIRIALVIPLLGIGLVAAQIFLPYRTIAKIFKWLTLSLLAYIGSAFLSHPDWRDVIHGSLVPHLEWNSKFLSMLVAILGTTISPYLFFWQADQEVEEKRDPQRQIIHDASPETPLRYMGLDVGAGMLASNAIMFFIIMATGATLHKAGTLTIDTATQAAEALRPLAGAASEVLMALGLIGSGILAIPVLSASAAYAVAQTFGWPNGLSEKPRAAWRFYAVMLVSTAIGLALNAADVSPIKALFYTAVINGFLAPPALIGVLLLANNRTVMGERVNGKVLNSLGLLTVLLMTASAVALAVMWPGA